MKAIRRLTQPSSDSCVATCMAMLVGDKEVDKDFHIAHYLKREVSIVKYLHVRGIRAWRPQYMANEFPHRLGQGYVFVVQTPSLNWENAMHMLIVDHRTEHPQVIDPMDGYDDKSLVYRKIGNDVTDLRFWTVEAVVDLA